MTPKILRCVDHTQAEFETEVRNLERRGEADLARVEPQVRTIIGKVRESGDSALVEYVREFEQRDGGQLTRDYDGESALRALPEPERAALTEAAARIREFHVRQQRGMDTFEYTADGVTLGTRVQPLESVGVYAPGGKASYPSSVLMSAIIAQVAGVKEIILATPDATAAVRAAAALSGVTAILDAGGAQAVAAMAYGTATVPKCDKIVGPGNIFVAAAKRLVFGDVAIDSIAGPSEILVLADQSASAAEIAADLLSQAEHDEAAYPLLALSSPDLLPAIESELTEQLSTLPRERIARSALEQHGLAICVRDRAHLAEIANRIAAEHVAVHTTQPRELANAVRNAGALFIGRNTPEAAGDYFAGPSHVLPTGGAVRFSSPLGVYDFITRTSLLEYSREGLERQAQGITTLARLEGLDAHARAVECRTQPRPKG